jgi:hypothetical protein
MSEIKDMEQKEISIEMSAADAPCPIVYGRCSVPGLMSGFGIHDASGDLCVRVIWCVGEVQAIEALYINGENVNTMTNVRYRNYRGTTYQRRDGWFATMTGMTGYDEEMKFTRPAGDLGVCYSVIRIPVGTITGAPRFQAIIQGLHIYSDVNILFEGTTERYRADPMFPSYVGFAALFDNVVGTQPVDGVDPYGRCEPHATLGWGGNAQVLNDQLELDGSGDYLMFSNSSYATFDHTTRRWGIEIRFTADDITTQTGYLCGLGDFTSGGYSFGIQQDDDDIRMFLSTNGTSWNKINNVIVAQAKVQVGVEHVLVVEYDGWHMSVLFDGATTHTRWDSDLVPYNPTNGAAKTRWRLGHRDGSTHYFDGRIRAFRYDQKCTRYGHAQMLQDGTPFIDSFSYRSGYKYENLAADCMGDLATNEFYGAGATSVEGQNQVVGYNLEDVNGVDRARLAIRIADNKPTSDWLRMLAEYAECFLFPQGESFKAVPDRIVNAGFPQGATVVVDGDMADSSGSAWTGLPGSPAMLWSGIFNVWIRDSDLESTSVSQAITLEEGVEYVMGFNISSVTAGDASLYLNGEEIIPPQTATGFYSVSIVPNAAQVNSTIEWRCSTNWRGWLGEIAVDRKWWPEKHMIAETLEVQGSSEIGTPTQVSVSYTTPAVDSVEWPTTNYIYNLPGVNEQDVALIETSLALEGVYRVEEAVNKAATKVAKLQGRITYKWESAEPGITLQKGTVVRAEDPVKGLTFEAIIDMVDVSDFGRYKVTAINYSDDHFPSEVAIEGPTGSVPVGVIAMMSGSTGSTPTIPAGWQQWSASASRKILGAGKNIVPGNQGGSDNTGVIAGELTLLNGDHDGVWQTYEEFYRVASDGLTVYRLSGGGLTGWLNTGDNPVEVDGEHQHTFSADSQNVYPPVREKVFIQKITTADVVVPEDVEVFSIYDNLSIPNLVRSTTGGGRYLRQGSVNDYGGQDFSTLANAVIQAANMAHDHFGSNLTPTVDGAEQQPYYNATKYTYDDGNFNHDHTITLTADGRYRTRRRRLAMYVGQDDFNVVKGVVFMWAGSIASIPSDYVLMNGKLDTLDMEDYFVQIANNGDHLGKRGGSAHELRVQGTSNTKYHSHQTTPTTNDTRQDYWRGYHDGSFGHNHVVDVDLPWTPAYYALAFIMYNPEPTTTWIDRGFQLNVGGVDGTSVFEDDGPDDLTITVTSNPQWDNSQQLHGVNTVLNGSGDRLSLPLFQWSEYTDRFTLEGFFRLNSSSNGVLFGNLNGGAEDFEVRYNAGVGVEFYQDSAVQHTTSDPGVGNWFYVCVEFDGSDFRFYYGLYSGGVAQLIGTKGDVITTHNTDLFIGNDAAASSYFRGHYAQIRQTRDAAIYQKSAFAIPTWLFTTTGDNEPV